MNKLNKWGLAGLVILLLVVPEMTYLPVLDNGFVAYDDPVMITRNPKISELTPGSIREIFTTFHYGLYHPLVLLSYAVENRLFGLSPAAFHADNLLLHLCNGLLVFMWLYLVTKELPVAFLTALLFAVHPQRVEVVAWASARKDLLYAFFFLFSLVGYEQFRRGNRERWYGFSLAMFGLSLLSKPMAVTLPLVLFLTAWFRKEADLRRTVYRLIPFIVLAAGFVVIAFAAQAAFPQRTFSISFGKRLLDSCGSVFFYVFKTAVPVNLSGIYPSFSFSPAIVIPLAVLAAPGLFILSRFCPSPGRIVLFGSLLFLIQLLPVLQIISFGLGVVADRYTYLASIGLLFIAAKALAAAGRCGGWGRTIALGLSAVVVAVFSVQSFHYSKVWKDTITLNDDILAKYPSVPTAYVNRVIGYMAGSNDYTRALSDLNEAIRLDPADGNPYYNRAVVHYYRKEYAIAWEDVRAAQARGFAPSPEFLKALAEASPR